MKGTTSENNTLDLPIVDRMDLFTRTFNAYYTDLVLFAGTYIYDKDACEDVVQTVFTRLWNDPNRLQDLASVKSYLLTSTRNGCLDYLHHQEVAERYAESILKEEFRPDYMVENYLLYSELERELNRALEKLTEMQRQCFILSRIEGLKYSEIADRLRVSVRTIELRVAQAKQILREELKDFLLILLVFLSIS